MRVEGDIRLPAKVRDVRPRYPMEAQKSRRQGIVTVQVTISPAGCVSQAEVLTSVSTDLDVETLRAVTGWVFTPTLLDGAPAAVILYVKVEFSLR